MATKSSSKIPAQVQPPTITPNQGIQLIQRQIEAGKKLMAQSYLDEDAYGAWKNTTDNYLIKAFGDGSANVKRFQDLGRIMMAPLNAPPAWWEQQWREGLLAKLVRLESYLELLRTEIELHAARPAAGLKAASPDLSSRKVFVVHGHNENLREVCARFLEKLELEPVILHEQPNAGRTIIEKFHDYSDVGFAVVLLTGDDKATTKDAEVATLRLRARQNVILELGFFLAKLGRSKVCAIYEPDVELPSDYEGVLFIKLDSAGAWRFQLCRELKAAGIDVDLNKAV